MFVEQEPNQGEPVVEMKVYRANPRVFYVATKPVLEVGKGTLEGAYLIEGKDKILSLQLHFTSRGSALLEEITTRFRQQRLFVVVAMPDKTDKKRVNGKSRLILGRRIGEVEIVEGVGDETVRSGIEYVQQRY